MRQLPLSRWSGGGGTELTLGSVTKGTRAEPGLPAPAPCPVAWQVTASGLLRPRQDVYLSPLDETLPTVLELHHPNFVLKLSRNCLQQRVTDRD